MPVDSGVQPLPHFCQANMLLQICIPLSFTKLTRTTFLPLAFMISETLQPNRLLRIWPKCKGLFVLGEEYSTTTFFPETGLRPNSRFSWFSLKKFTQNLSEINKLRKPFTTLNLAIISDSLIISAPISLANCSGLRPANFPKGNTTMVMSPSNSGRVFWKFTCCTGGSCPYKVANDFINNCLNTCSNIITLVFLIAKLQNFTKTPYIFSFFPLRKRKLSYLCSPMRYPNKPSEKIICTESNGSIKMNFPFSILTVTLLAVFFLQHQQTKSISLCQFH